MKKFTFTMSGAGLLVAVLYLLLTVSCKKTDSKEVKDETPEYDITFFTSMNVSMGPGGKAVMEFILRPDDLVFNHDLSSEECQIRLKVLESSDGETVGSPVNYSLVKVEPIVDIYGKSKPGQYSIMIEDLRNSEDYLDIAVIEIVGKNADGESVTVVSDELEIYFSGNNLYSFAFTVEDNPGTVIRDIKVDMAEEEVQIVTPYISSPRLAASFRTNADRVLVNGVRQISGETVNDFSNPVTYRVISAEGKEVRYKVSLSYSGLPVVEINTPQGTEIPPKSQDWLSGAQLNIYRQDGTLDYNGTVQIRGRGNTTWNYPKKPYAIRLESKAEILGMPKHKRWVLLANWMDRTLLRNAVSFKIAMLTSMAWTPHGEFVDVVLNGKHIGNYYLCEQIKVDNDRVDIDSPGLDETAEPAITGGYLLELDIHHDEAFKFRSSWRNLPYMFKDPDEVNETQSRWLQNYVTEMERSLYEDRRFAAREYLSYLDQDSFIDYWIVYEITQNDEPGWPKSTYMYKPVSGKMYAGPVWDFDWGTFTSEKWFVAMGGIYYPRLFEDSAFKKRTKERWNQLEPQLRQIPDFIDEQARLISASERMNHAMWPINQDVNGDERKTFTEAIQQMKANYMAKLEYMDTEINKW